MTGLNQATQSAVPAIDNGNDQVNISEYLDILWDDKWLIAFVAGVILVLGVAYALLARPVYDSNILIQVEDSDKSAGSFLGNSASSILDVKTPAAGEIEIIRSRLILGQAVENSKIFIEATPRYIPLIGRWLANRSKELSEPGVFGVGGFVSGTEAISVTQFDVPAALEDAKFKLTLLEGGKFQLESDKLEVVLSGLAGRAEQWSVPGSGIVRLFVAQVSGKNGAEFQLVRSSTQQVLNKLQDDIQIVEKGKQSGVISVGWQYTDSLKLTTLLNEIGRLYVKQNVERKAAEAEKTLGFLGSQLPQFKKQMEVSEDVYNRYRNEKGTVSLDDEAKNALVKLVDLQAKLLDAQQRKIVLQEKLTPNHPSVKTVDAQIEGINIEIGTVNNAIKKMPLVQQDTVRMQRDIKVSTDLYVSLLNSSLQMNLAKEGKIGNVRLLDEAVVPEEPIKPKKPLIVLGSLLMGLVAGAILAIMRKAFFGGVRNPTEIEMHTGLNVYSTIPLSTVQAKIDRDIKDKKSGLSLLFHLQPEDPAIESIRSLRTALQFSMLESRNNRILISGGTPGVGKSFVSSNLAAVLANSGKKVLLIDADLRKGYINQVFQRKRSNGLSEYIAGTKALSDVVHVEVMPGLDLITTGTLPPNPAELLMSDSFVDILDRISPMYDVVVIDTAPVLVASDTASVAPLAGTVLLVARAEKTHIGELNESAKRLAHVGCNVNGVILNAMDMTRRYSGNYGYTYGSYRYTQYKY